jgi:hypothetical protein
MSRDKSAHVGSLLSITDILAAQYQVSDSLTCGRFPNWRNFNSKWQNSLRKGLPWLPPGVAGERAT